MLVCRGEAAEEMGMGGEEERVATLLGIAEECDTEEELRLLLRGNPHPVCYDSFLPCDRMTIAQVSVLACLIACSISRVVASCWIDCIFNLENFVADGAGC